MGNVIDKVLGIAGALIVLCVGSGHGEWVWKGIAYVQYQALTEARMPWRSPSIFQYSHKCKISSFEAHPVSKSGDHLISWN